MTRDQEWEFARWLYRQGPTLRKDIPRRFPAERSRHGLYSIANAHLDPAGYFIPSPNDRFYLSDNNRDAFADEKSRRGSERRSKIAVWLSIAALVVSLISILWQIYTWREEKGLWIPGKSQHQQIEQVHQ